MTSPLFLSDELRPTCGPGALCIWCGDPIPSIGARSRLTRRDAFTCSQACRQASWRFGFAGPDWIAEPGSLEPRRFAYLDPPYPGMSWRYYRDHPDYAGEVDHHALVLDAIDRYPDGWALSTSSSTLRPVLALIPPNIDVRIGAWTKPSPPRHAQRGRRAWEPVVFVGGRPRPSTAPMILDWIHCAPPRGYPGAVPGIKPSKFSVWIFNNLGAQPCDTLDDPFIGSGAVSRAWRRYIGAEQDRPRPITTVGDADDASPLATAGVDASRHAAALFALNPSAARQIIKQPQPTRRESTT